MVKKTLKIGVVAKKTGLTVRTLHHYDQIGLLKPSDETESGHRLYTDSDIVRLHQIVTLKQLGFTLEEIKDMMNNSDYNPKEMLNLQLSRLNEHINQLVELRNRLQDIIGLLDVGGAVSSERFLMTIQMMKMIESPYFSEKHKAEMLNKYKTMTANELRQNNEAGKNLLSEFRAMMESGKLPSDSEVAPLAKRWILEIESVAPEGFIQSAEQYYSENSDESIAYGMDSELYFFIKEAVSHIHNLYESQL
ncbi:MerR family transcriptional regulator [Paenibacillus montaniterrae]|uniref:MerR family transcriptional regulator n=1 Tax=Paenibacillus montaniterrae TaxID=429341 RepID=A0A920D0I9_9BACL|nr:MerR family transcriptional regulator [Paenibacillus montaniterrae]GIP18608.1 MerR family transcriptional regulator [Paenibacillus montaniterrae]